MLTAALLIFVVVVVAGIARHHLMHAVAGEVHRGGAAVAQQHGIHAEREVARKLGAALGIQGADGEALSIALHKHGVRSGHGILTQRSLR